MKLLTTSILCDSLINAISDMVFDIFVHFHSTQTGGLTLDTDLYTANVELEQEIFLEDVCYGAPNNVHQNDVSWDNVLRASTADDFILAARTFLMNNTSDCDRARRVIEKGKASVFASGSVMDIICRFEKSLKRVSGSIQYVSLIKKLFVT